jgi:hypothetical protein
LPKDLTHWDKKIFDLLYSKYKDYRSFYFIKYPLKNYDLLKNLSKKTIHQRQNIIYLTVLKYLRLVSINNNFIDFILKIL